MGVDKLFPNIKDAAKEGNIFSDCEGRHVGLDMSCWLHRFATWHPHEVCFGDYSYIASD